MPTTDSRPFRCGLIPERRQTIDSIRKRNDLSSTIETFDFVFDEVMKLVRRRLFPASRALEQVARSRRALPDPRRPAVRRPDHGYSSVRLSERTLGRIRYLRDLYELDQDRVTINYVLREVDELDRLGLFPAEALVKKLN